MESTWYPFCLCGQELNRLALMITKNDVFKNFFNFIVVSLVKINLIFFNFVSSQKYYGHQSIRDLQNFNSALFRVACIAWFTFINILIATVLFNKTIYNAALLHKRYLQYKSINPNLYMTYKMTIEIY